MDWGSVGLVLRAAKVAGPHRWRWLLVDESSGAPLADHRVELDPESTEVEAFDDLYRFLRRRADPDRRVASEAELLGRVGAWIGSVALGERIGRAIVRAAPVTVRVQVPAGAEFLAFRPWELAHVDGVPLAARGDVALVYDLPGLAGASQAKASVGAALRMLAVFSLPTATSALALRRERYELTRLVRRVAARSRRRVELEVAQYGVTRAKLADLAESGDGWDVLHLSGHGGAGQFLLERADGSPDPVSTAELITLLRPLRSRVKLDPGRAGDGRVSPGAAAFRGPRRGDGRHQRRPGPGLWAHRGGVPRDGRRGQDRLRAGAGLPSPAGLRGVGVLVGGHRPRPVR